MTTTTEQMPVYDGTDRRLSERIFHAISFECIATMICAPLFAYIMNQSILDMGALTLMFATIAMTWNFFYNILFDKIFNALGLFRTFWVRIVHALLFECGLIFILVPVGAWWLSVSLQTAFFMNIGMIFFFLPYTIIFNWIYDAIRKTLWVRQMQSKNRSK